MSFGRFVTHQSRAVLLVVALLSVTGIVALFRIPRALFPQTDFPRIVVIANNGVAPAQQTLVAVTRPIEEAMSGIPGIARIRSVTARGSSEVNLFFDWQTDIHQTLQLVQTTVSSLASKLPPGVSFEQASFRELLVALALAIALVFVVLVVEFRSFAHPAAIVCGAVLAIPGSLVALLLTHTTLNVVSMMGLIMVIGIVSKNGILMLDTVEDHIHAGQDVTTALLQSGRRRFRPVLMTSLAAMLGMLPLALALGSGSELLQPLAICVIGGLLFALVLSLVVTPTVYALIRTRDSA